jgi:glyoxylase-like metal-dependent hydrolase (beta-lactamase superfamily II)
MPFTQLVENLYVHHGIVNVGIVRSGHRALLLDCGGGDILDTLAELGITQVDAILFTHHHRDQAWGVHSFAGDPPGSPGVRIGVPAGERAWFEDVESYWADPARRWHLYDFNPHNLMLGRSVPVHAAYREGDTLQWEDAEIAVLDTPGHTDGSVSYQVDLGAERYMFCGDVLYGDGQVWDVYSLQKGWLTRDYHGFMGGHKRLIASARKLDSRGAMAWIPSHGPIVRDPSRSVALLEARLRAGYERYAAISALRHYFPGLFREFHIRKPGDRRARAPHRTRTASDVVWREGFMPLSASVSPPGFMRHVGTSWMVVSRDGAAFVIDCGTQDVIRQVEAMLAQGEIGAVEGLWISHYHDDHVDAIPQFREAFRCPVLADTHVARVVEHPLAWRLPCISPVTVPVDRRTVDGESWTWREFTMTAYHLPGQTLYHGGLLVEGRGRRIFLAGDSFTMAGMDDYCAGNRNFLGPGAGFDACLQLLQTLQPDLILNCHVDVGWTFNDEQLATMRANLAERERLFGDLLPWDHANYGLDDSWVRCFPYEQRVSPGEQIGLEVVFTNHSAGEREAVCRPVLPRAWNVEIEASSARIAPQEERGISFRMNVPQDAAPGRCVVPIEVTYGGRPLGPFREAILDVVMEPSGSDSNSVFLGCV